MGHAVRGRRLHSFAITAGARLDGGSHRRGLPSLRVNRVDEEDREGTYVSSITKIPDMSVEITRRTCACHMRIMRYLRELYDQPKVALSLKT